MIETWQLRARFAQALAMMYGREVPAYRTLTDVTWEVNAQVVASDPVGAQRLGTLERVSGERHGAIRLGTPAEMRAAAVVFAGFGMYPVGFYDLRDSAPTPVPVVSTAFRPIAAEELARNPFRVFTSLLATGDPRFFHDDLRRRLETFLSRRQLFGPELLALAAQAAASGGLPEPSASRLVELATDAFALSNEPIDRGWYAELEAVSPVAADIGGVTSTHVNHLTPRVLDIDALYERMGERGIQMIDRIQGPPRWSGPAVLLRQTSFRALAEPRQFRESDGTVTTGTLRVRFGEVEARGIALTPTGRDLYDRLVNAGAAQWEAEFPRTEAELEAKGLAYFNYRTGHPEPIVYEDFLPRSAAGIFQSNLDRRPDHALDNDDDGRILGREASAVPRYNRDWLSAVIDRDVQDPFELYRAQQERSRP